MALLERGQRLVNHISLFNRCLHRINNTANLCDRLTAKIWVDKFFFPL